MSKVFCWSSVLFAYLGLFAYGMADSVRMPVFSEFLRELHLSQTKGSLFFALSSGVAILGSWSCHSFMNRWGRDLVYAVSLVAMALGCLGFFLSDELLILLLSSVIFGWSMGQLGVMVNLYISTGVPPVHQRKFFSGLHSMYGLAAFVAPLIVVATQALQWSWRYSFLIVSSFIFTLGVGRWLTRRTSWDLDAQQENIQNKFEKSSETGLEDFSRSSLKSPGSTFSWFDSFVLSGILGWYVVAEILVSSRLALYMTQMHGLSLSMASQWLSAFFAALLLGRFVGTFFHFPFSLRSLLAGSNILTFICLFLGVFVNPLFLVLSGLTMSVFYPVAMSYISTFARGDLGKIMSVTLAVQSLLIMKMHLLVGYLSDWISLQWALLYGGAAVFFSLICLVIYELKVISR